MEELRFKPISKGLGFHKNKLKIDEEALRDIHWKKEVELPEIDFQEDSKDDFSASTKDSTWDDLSTTTSSPSYRKPNFDLLADDGINVEQVKKELEQKALLSKTLPRNDIKTEAKAFAQNTAKPVVTKSESPSIEKNLDSIRDIEKRIEESKKEDILNVSEEVLEEKVSGNWFAAIVDFVAVVGLLNLFMASLLFVTKLDVFEIIKTSYQDPMTQISLAVLFIGVSFLYVVVSRSFFGMTFGDWALDMRLGTDEERLRMSYPIKVALRYFVALATGFVLLPFLSVIFRRDLLGLITGLNLYRLKE
jgi:hypothetical protein